MQEVTSFSEKKLNVEMTNDFDELSLENKLDVRGLKQTYSYLWNG
jgi:hypothetical protein